MKGHYLSMCPEARMLRNTQQHTRLKQSGYPHYWCMCKSRRLLQHWQLVYTLQRQMAGKGVVLSGVVWCGAGWCGA